MTFARIAEMIRLTRKMQKLVMIPASETSM